MSDFPCYLPSLLDTEDKNCILKNRIRKNYQHLRKWAKRTHTDCFRIYDRDIKEYPVAIDFYAGRFCVQYFSYDREHDETPPSLQQATNQALLSLFGVNKEAIYERTRIRRKKVEQYEKVADEDDFFIVYEYGVKFKVNLLNYLDTGLFLDHRETRQRVASLCQGKRLLNLFAYTCSFSVQAAVAGACYTKSVDMSNTYTSWGRDNFTLNQLPLQDHDIVRADCLKFLDEAVQKKERYDVIVIDPPTLSRSKKMDQMFDIQLDYISLLSKALKLLSEGGKLVFSTNLRSFSFDVCAFPSYQVQDITEKTLPLDFHNKKIHKCWILSKKSCPQV
ncbi:MAG: class I SAM-dependent methyltransferase [Verrucomicrobia bacterium]|nr:class I SAM-dependent methyltransferase [Verrucomicrobiota bacterium]MBS0645732.1 class I SAM-dependent methyltransferase [Verrucomicrobiota bacterium]